MRLYSDLRLTCKRCVSEKDRMVLDFKIWLICFFELDLMHLALILQHLQHIWYLSIGSECVYDAPSCHIATFTLGPIIHLPTNEKWHLK